MWSGSNIQAFVIGVNNNVLCLFKSHIVRLSPNAQYEQPETKASIWKKSFI